MTFFLHKISGLVSSGQFWSTGMISSGAITEGAAETAWGGAWHTFFTTAGVAALYSTSMHYTASNTSTASALFKQTTITRSTHADVGTAATQELPDYCSMVITSRVGAGDKSAHGRLFLPAPVAAALAVGTGGHLAAGSVTTFVTNLNTLFATLVAAGLQPVILTRRSTRSGLGALSTRPWSFYDMGNLLHVQKRRGDKVVNVRVNGTI